MDSFMNPKKVFVLKFFMTNVAIDSSFRCRIIGEIFVAVRIECFVGIAFLNASRRREYT